MCIFWLCVVRISKIHRKHSFKMNIYVNTLRTVDVDLPFNTVKLGTSASSP